MAQQPFDRVQHAWQVHQAVQNWTNQAETKATFLLTIESALLVFFLNRGAAGELFTDITKAEANLAYTLLLIGLALLLRGIVLLVMVVYPRLREKELKREKWRNAIYFGHLAGQNPKAIENILRRRDPLEQLSRQLRAMGDIALHKYQLLRQSILGSSFGLGLILLSFVLWEVFKRT